MFCSEPKTIPHIFRNIRKIAPDELCSTLLEADWSALSLSATELNVKQGLATLTDNLQDTMDKLAAERSVNHRKPIPPWLTADIRLLGSKRDATVRKYDRGRLSFTSSTVH